MKHIPRPVSFVLLPLLGLGGCAALGGNNAPVVTNETRMNVAMAAEASGDTQSAIQIYSAALAKDPSNPDIVVKYARALVNARQVSLARELLSRKLGEQPGQPDMSREFATIQVLQGQPQEAVAGFDVLLKANGQDVRALVNKAIALDMMGRHGDAQALYRKADVLSPDDPAVRNNLAMSLMLHGHIAEASQVLQTLPASATVTPRMRNNMAVVAAANGDFAQARELTQGQISDAELRRLVSRLPGTEQAPGSAEPQAPAARSSDAQPEAGRRARDRRVKSAPIADAVPVAQPSAAASYASASVPEVKAVPLMPAPAAVPTQSARVEAPAAPVASSVPASAPAGVTPEVGASPAPLAGGNRLSTPGAIPLTVPAPGAVAAGDPGRSAPQKAEQTGRPAKSTKGSAAQATRTVVSDQGDGWRAPPVESVQAAGPVALYRAGNSEPLTIAAPTVAPEEVRHGYSVQFASVSTEREARAEWRRLSTRLPDQFAGREASIQHGSLSSGREVWRVRTGGFAGYSAAKEFCAEVQQAGQGCIVVRHGGGTSASRTAPLVTGSISRVGQSPEG